MRNGIFIVLFAVIFIFMFIGAPLTAILIEEGVLPYENVGNEIVADKTYDENRFLGGFLNQIETVKTTLKDVYINNLPFFLNITNTYKPFKNTLNQFFSQLLQNLGNSLTQSFCDHRFTDTVVSPTCETEGYTERVCRLCQERVVENVTPARGHSFSFPNEVAPTCEVGGYSVEECTVCHKIETHPTKSANGHHYILIDTLPSDCKTGGMAKYRCDGCESTVTRPLPLGSHSYKKQVFAPTATQAGYTLYSCACGDSYCADFRENGRCTHRFRTQTVFADCEHVGVKRHVCEACGYTEETKIEDALGHCFVKKNTVTGTCEQVGYTVYACTDCAKEEYRDPVLPQGHRYLISITQPTCTSEGRLEKNCTLCGAVGQADVFAAPTHDYHKETVPPTATDYGYDVYICKVCKHTYEDNFTPPTSLYLPDPETTPDPKGTVYSAVLKTTDNIFRHYEITATFPDGTKKTTYTRVVKLNRDQMYDNMLDTAELVNALVEKDRSVNWYFSFATNLEATALGQKILPEESTLYIYEDFLANLDSSVSVNSVLVNSFTDYYDKFYITDHHWNHHGSEEAYLGFVKMLIENYPDVKPLDATEICEFDGVRFYGSLALALANYKYSDTFGYYNRDLPEHSVVIDNAIKYGSRVDIPQNLATYRRGEYSTKRGYNHYTSFYRVCEKITYPENNTGRNLLIIGDSYSLPLLELVASHFDNTYIRYEDRSWSSMPPDLFYEEFIEERGITDVLVIEEMARCVMEGYGTSLPSRFIAIYPDRSWKEED